MPLLPTNSNYQNVLDEIEYLGIFNKRKSLILDRERSAIISGTDEYRKVF